MRYGLVGTGHWATATHAPAIGAADGTELVGVWGRDPAKAADVADTFGCTAHEDVDDLFAAVDAVAFAVPPDVQADLASRAADHGCHLLLDKPVALDLDAADRLVGAVEAAGVASRVFFTFRFHPVVARWLSDVRAGDGWRGGRATWFASPFATDSPYRDSTWRQQHGALWDVGPHALSLLLPLLGEVTDVTALGRRDGSVHAGLVHDDGHLSSLDCSFVLPPATAHWEVSVYGDHGWSSMPPVVEPAPAALACAIAELEAAAADREPSDDPCDAAFGRDVVAVLARIDRALGSPAG